MRVLLVADIAGGVRTFVRELVPRLRGAGVEVDLALLGAGEFERASDASTCEVRDLRLEWMEDPWDDVSRTGEWIKELRARHAPDVVHMNTFAPVLDPDVPVLLTVHSCVLSWWRAVHGVDAPTGWRRYAELARAALDRASLLAIPTRALHGALAGVYGPLPPARVIPNGRAVRVPARSREDRLVVSVGRLWDTAKNAALTARAAPSIDGRVVLIGPGELDDVESTGPLAPREVVDWLSRAAVFVEPARYEPFGLAALEAALCGCALVLGDIPSLREVWGEAATFVSPDDAYGLARVVGALLDDPARRERAAHAARIRAARYSPAAMARGYLSAYRQLARVALPA